MAKLSSTQIFGNLYVDGNTTIIGNIDGTISNATNAVNSDKLDNLHATSFLRTDTDSTLVSGKSIVIDQGPKVIKTTRGAITGGADVASSTDANLRIHSWYGIGFAPSISGQSVPQGENATWFNVRTGNAYTRGNWYANNNKPVWHSGNLAFGTGANNMATGNHGHTNTVIMKSNHTSDWTSSSVMTGKTYAGGWHGALTSGTEGYISLGASSSQILHLIIDGDFYARENKKVYHEGFKPSVSDIGASPSNHNHDNNYTKKVNLRGQCQKTSYRKSVIALCELKGPNISFNSYSIGKLIFHRDNGLTGSMFVDIAVENYYSGDMTMSGSMLESTVVGSIRLCTFIHGGKNYGGVEFFFSDAEFQTVEFLGSSNFAIFALDYTDSRTGQPVLNVEVNNSLNFTDKIRKVGELKYNNYKVYHTNSKPTLAELGASPSGHTHSYLPLSGGTLTGSISYSGGGWSGSVIEFRNQDNNGVGMGIGSGGTTIIASGEAKGQVFSNNPNNGSETLFLSSDQNIIFNTKLQDGWANRKTMEMKTDGELYINNNKVYHLGHKPSAGDIGASPSNHTHNYLPLSGGTLTGRLTLNSSGMTFPTTGSSWINGKTTTNVINVTGNSSRSYHPIMRYGMVSGNVANIGSLGDHFGFFGYKSTTSENRTDCSAYLDVANSRFAATKFYGPLQGNSDTTTKLATARTISLTGDASGSATFDGSANASITVVVNDNSHNHSSISTQSVVDWNTAQTNGFWQGESKPNAPEASGWFWGYRMQHGGGYGAQIAVKNGGNRIYFRSQDTNGAGNWNNVYHTGYKPNMLDVGGNMFGGGNDLNTYNPNRIWSARTSNTTNNRPGDWFTVLNVGADSNSNFQLASYYGGTDQFKYRGRSDGGTYRNWQDILMSESYVGTSRDTFIAYPKDGRLRGTASSITGCIKITLPQSWSSTMMRFTVDIYNYATNSSVEFVVGGYNYNTTDSTWVNTFAYATAHKDSKYKNLNVRFGHDGAKCAIYIGETNTTWSYTHVSIRNIAVGYSNSGLSAWNQGWAIGFTTTLGNIKSTITNTNSALTTPQEISAVPVSTGGNITIHADSDSSSTSEYLNLQAGGNFLKIKSNAGGSSPIKNQESLVFNDHMVWTKGNTSNFGITNTSPTTGHGISLYGGSKSDAPDYGLMFAGTGAFGTHGAVTSDWAIYSNMAGSTSRGWVFKSGKTSGGNIASISATGVAVFNSKLAVGNNINPAITLALGDTDTGFKWVSDGIFELFTNNIAIAKFNTTGIHLNKPIITGSTDLRSNGMYGIYDSNKIGHIWSMGTAYKILDNGTTFGNLYGLAYKHTNNATGGTMAGGHQMVWCENGVPKAALGSSGIWTGGYVNGASSTITGNLYAGNLESKGYLNLVDSNTKLLRGSGNTVKIQTNSGNIEIGPMNSSHAHIYTDRPSFYFNKELLVNNQTVYHNGNVGKFVTGQNGTGTTSINNLNSIWKSGFYEINSGSNKPDTTDWHWVIHAAHTSNNSGGSYNYGLQIAGSNGTSSFYMRNVNASGTGTWRRLLHASETVFHMNHMYYESETNYSITFKDHSNHTWLRNAGTGCWTFQSGLSRDDWSKTVTLRVPDTGVTNSTQWFELGQQSSNNTHGAYRGLWVTQYLNGGKTDGDIYAREGHFRDIHMRKVNNGWSTIYFDAPSGGNDPGYIGHHENSNASQMRFVVSDDPSPNDTFLFGSTPSGSFNTACEIRSDGYIRTSQYGWLHERFASSSHGHNSFGGNDLTMHGKRFIVCWSDGQMSCNYYDFWKVSHFIQGAKNDRHLYFWGNGSYESSMMPTASGTCNIGKSDAYIDYIYRRNPRSLGYSETNDISKITSYKRSPYINNEYLYDSIKNMKVLGLRTIAVSQMQDENNKYLHDENRNPIMDYNSLEEKADFKLVLDTNTVPFEAAPVSETDNENNNIDPDNMLATLVGAMQHLILDYEETISRLENKIDEMENKLNGNM